MVSAYKNGVLNRQEEWTYEYQLPDRIRYLQVETFEGKSRKIEQINIGKIMYCRRNDSEWKISNSYCIGGSGSGGPSNIIEETYHREKTVLGSEKTVLYRNYIVHQNQYSKTAETNGRSFWESKFWVNNDGLIVRSESKRGLVSGPTMESEIIETFEYDSNIKIEAPIR